MNLSTIGRRLFNKLSARLVEWLASTGIGPNLLTLAGLLLTGIATLLYYLASRQAHYMLYAGGFLAAGSLFDGLDGALARRLGVASRRGAFIDSTVDRVEDSLVALGVMLSGFADGVLVLIMLATSMLVSYSRARAEALGVEMAGVGIAERWLRLVMITAATLATPWIPEALEITVAIVALLSAVTVAQRLVYALKKLS